MHVPVSGRLAVSLVAVVLACGAAWLVVATGEGERRTSPRPAAETGAAGSGAAARQAAPRAGQGRVTLQLVASGLTRYRAYATGEASSAADRARALVRALRAGDHVAVRRYRSELSLHLGRLDAALSVVGPGAVAATRTDRLPAALGRARLDAGRVLLAAVSSLRATVHGRPRPATVESRLGGAIAAFDAVRDALWASQPGLVGSIDRRFDAVRRLLEGHRRGEGFSTGALSGADARELRRAVEAVARRLEAARARTGVA